MKKPSSNTGNRRIGPFPRGWGGKRKRRGKNREKTKQVIFCGGLKPVTRELTGSAFNIRTRFKVKRREGGLRGTCKSALKRNATGLLAMGPEEHQFFRKLQRKKGSLEGEEDQTIENDRRSETSQKLSWGSCLL